MWKLALEYFIRSISMACMFVIMLLPIIWGIFLILYLISPGMCLLLMCSPIKFSFFLILISCKINFRLFILFSFRKSVREWGKFMSGLVLIKLGNMLWEEICLSLLINSWKVKGKVLNLKLDLKFTVTWFGKDHTVLATQRISNICQHMHY